MNFIRTSLLGLLALPLAAQSTGFNVGGALILAPEEYFGSYEKAVHNNAGALINVGYDFNFYHTDIFGRGTLSFATMPGGEDNGLKTSLSSVQLAGDVFLPTAIQNLHGVVGVSINYYSASFSGTESWDPNDVEHHFAFKDIEGLKLGYRLGLEYSFSKSLSGEILMQQTELAGHTIAGDTFIRRGGINPAWLQLGVHYHF
jgi:hypothetical protein